MHISHPTQQTQSQAIKTTAGDTPIGKSSIIALRGNQIPVSKVYLHLKNAGHRHHNQM